MLYKKRAGWSVHMVAVSQHTAKTALALNYRKISLRRELISRDWYDFCSEDESWLINLFHLFQQLLLMLWNISEPALFRPTKWSCAIFCACPGFVSALDFFATGLTQRGISDRSGMSQPTMSCSMPCTIFPKTTVFPHNTLPPTFPRRHQGECFHVQEVEKDVSVKDCC